MWKRKVPEYERWDVITTTWPVNGPRQVKVKGGHGKLAPAQRTYLVAVGEFNALPDPRGCVELVRVTYQANGAETGRTVVAQHPPGARQMELFSTESETRRDTLHNVSPSRVTSRHVARRKTGRARPWRRVVSRLVSLAVVLLLVGCGACADPEVPEEPAVVVVVDRDAWTPDELVALERGAHAWGALGFAGELADVYDDFPIRSCPRRWYQREPREVDCAIYVRLERERLSGRLGYTVRELRLVVVDDRLLPVSLQTTLAHELGHVVLDTDEHAEGWALMRYSTPAPPAPTEIDFELACRTIGACL